MSPSELLKRAIHHFHGATPHRGLTYALAAATASGEPENAQIRRRALNIASAISLMIDESIEAINYGLQSAALARRLNSDELLVTALVNVTTGLTERGLAAKTLHTANRVEERFAQNSNCQSDVRLVLSGAAHACLRSDLHREAISYSERAIRLSSEPSDADSAAARILDELNWMKAALALGRSGEVQAKLRIITQIEAAFPSARATLNRRFAQALALQDAHGKTPQSLQQLLMLVKDSQAHATIHSDAVRAAMHCAEALSDHERALSLQLDTSALNKTKKIKRLQDVQLHGESYQEEFLARLQPGKSLEELLVQAEIERERTSALVNARLRSVLESISANGCDTNAPPKLLYQCGKLAGLTAEAMGYRPEQARALELATRLHHVGAEETRRIAAKASPLAWLEWVRHTSTGAELLQACGSGPAFELAASVARHHHERWDGMGYPHQNAREETPEAARIAAIAIRYVDCTSRDQMTHPTAAAHLAAEAGREFDPAITKIFLQTMERLRSMHGDDLPAYLSTGAPDRSEAKEAARALNDVVPEIEMFA